MRKSFAVTARLALAAILTILVLAAVSWEPAVACPPTGCATESDPEPEPVGNTTDGTQQETYTAPTKSCSVYANGGGMGMYCVSLLGGDTKTLRERFGKQNLQTCRYSEIPKAIQTPFNANPGEGRYMIMTCLGNIDFDTYAGGPDRTVDVQIVFVPDGTDTEDRHNGITDFLWESFGNSSTQMPVPFMRTRPNITPLVGIPTFFTFRWIDPIDKNVVAKGPYAGSADGGPYQEVTEQGVTMRARATEIRIDANQRGIPAVTCDPTTPYTVGAKPSAQPAGACKITFPRSSASARKYATDGIPSNLKDAFYADVEVTWEVTYGEDGSMSDLGDGFTMRLKQVLPVQEVQAPNQPPAVIY
ncbi:hypothetical protein [Aeromicrobium sp.]|uniref:hypothetical protein n=1 Tax=Aeromicrobium sp. TaxID=1871063 RepID=UPI0030C55878